MGIPLWAYARALTVIYGRHAREKHNPPEHSGQWARQRPLGLVSVRAKWIANSIAYNKTYNTNQDNSHSYSAVAFPWLGRLSTREPIGPRSHITHGFWQASLFLFFFIFC